MHINKWEGLSYSKRNEVNAPSNSFLSTVISRDFAYAKNPTINWHGMPLGPTRNKNNKNCVINRQ